MLKVLVVDDEMLVRIGIQSLISWKEHGFEIVGDAENGEEALDMIEKTMPDIVLTDIVMPGMDGLELIEKIKKKFPDIRICVLSSYSDYDYVRRAMKLGADDYYLKASMKPDELLRLLEELKRQMQTHEDKAVEVIPDEQFQLIQTGTMPEWLRELIHSQPCRIVYIRTHRYHQRSQGEGAVHKSLVRLLEQQLHDAACSSIFVYKKDSWVTVLPEEDVLEKATDFIVAVRRFLDVAISVGCSDVLSEADDLQNAFMQAEQAWEYSFYEGKGKVHIYDITYFANEHARNMADEAFGRLLQQLEREGDNHIDDYVGQIFNNLPHSKASIAHNIEVFLEIWECIKRFLKRRGIDNGFGKHYKFETPVYQRIMQIETLAEAEQFFGMLLNSYKDWVQRWKQETYSDDIRKLLDYLHDHYREHISLRVAAEYINISESHLSYLFKKETQKSVIEYVSELRMNEAAALLRDTDLPNYEIAEKVGYQNINYFGRIFKKWKGMSPSYYRERFRQ